MKVFLVLLSLSAVAFASLEPAGYRPPGTSSQYLPPHLQRRQHQSQQAHQSEAASPLTATSNQYLPPSYSRAAPVASPQYLPPQSQQQQQPLPRPSSNYLPATDKPVLSSLPPAPPSNEYLPPAPSSEYLPPVTRTQPAKEYLPVQVPSNEYLPPVPKNEYLPATALSKKPAASPVPVAPKGDYLPPAGRQSAAVQSPAPATLTGRISVISVSPFKLDGPAYSKSQRPQKQQQQQQQQQVPGKFSGAGLATSATSSPFSGYPSRNPGLAVKGYEQPADNYLPPLSSGASEDYDAARSGYRYGAAGAAGPLRAVEQSTEPAKYDFEYRVSDEFGNDYAHKESRDGSQTQGVYSVLLPDGRKQIVRYEADENGFKPRISYEEAATVLGSKAPDAAAFAGYDGNANDLESRGPY